MSSDLVEIVVYCPEWPAQYEAERERLEAAIGALPIQSMNHIGSTAVPGLSAKPIIDILVVTAHLEQARVEFPDRLLPLGYLFWDENPDPDHLFFVKGLPPMGEGRTHHVHVVAPGAVADRHILFRDYLRAHPTEAAAYAVFKRELAAIHAADREAYTLEKTAFVDRVIALAERWRTGRPAS